MGVAARHRQKEAELPAWLQGLMGETFFTGCEVHLNRRKNEKNIFCLACCLSFCNHCLPSHRPHPLLQVRRYVYHDVVRLDDLQKLIDCAYVQVDHLVREGEDLSVILYVFEASNFEYPQFEGDAFEELDDDDGQNDENSMTKIEEDHPLTHSGSSSSSKPVASMGSSGTAVAEPAELVVKRKKKGRGFVPGIVLSLNSCRRKGAPQRSPLS
ncbi:hypothetical protein Nepgr_022900 [Nepenthes gracilis]|uniref:B box-type domain-containing protein n=1 Tax=Nepenthes gracilis TaxID=150966 RepID=A0AAD3XXF1_NEPGR|nr:hypothetical protein Nepgr_022900 [Nepenthes gracilis]